MVFDAIETAVASWLSVSNDVAGFLLGFGTVGVLFIAFLWVTDKGEADAGYIGGAIGVVFVIGVGWWPIWSAIFIVLILAVIIIRPFGGSVRGGL